MVLSAIVILFEKQMPLLEAPFGPLTRRTFLHSRIELYACSDVYYLDACVWCCFVITFRCNFDSCRFITSVIAARPTTLLDCSNCNLSFTTFFELIHYFYDHVTVLHRKKFVTFMWPCCIVKNLLRSCDRAAS